MASTTALVRSGSSYKERYERAMAATARARARLGDTVTGLVTGLEVSGAAFALGAFEGHSGPSGAKIMGIPAGLLIGAGAHALCLAGVGGRRNEDHLRAIGNGLLAGHAAIQGQKFGAQWAAEGKFPGFKSMVSGALGDGSMGAGLSDLANQFASY